MVSKSTFYRHRAVVHSQKRQSLADVDLSMSSGEVDSTSISSLEEGNVGEDDHEPPG